MRKHFGFLAMLFACLLSFTAAASAQHIAIPKTIQSVVDSPTKDDIARAVAKALGAAVSHELSKPQPCDGILEGLARGVARQARDELIDSALQDLSPKSKAFERAAIRNLVVVALDGKLPRDRDQVLAQLRRAAPDAADAVEIVEFLIRFSQAIDKSK